MSLRTWIYTVFNGELVGLDEFQNTYYRSKKKKLKKRERRWVVYNGIADASSVPAEWHAWLHYTVDEPLTEAAAQSYSWQKSHSINKTGTSEAYSPSKKDLNDEAGVPKTAGSYEPWIPN
jgi:NADH:ubiquinone oxidoreductase subunit